ncbi:MAG: HAD-IIB family hydrolase, partial [Mariprofundaceae bacterium]
GRHFGLAREGQQEFGLPEPTYWVCNVGTEIYNQKGIQDIQWQGFLGPAFDQGAMCRALEDIRALTLQEGEKQGPHKLSFYTQGKVDKKLSRLVLERMKIFRSDLRLVNSVEEASNRGLLDILPDNSGKSAALHYLAEKLGFAPPTVFFAGDSGNDRDVLLSGVCGTLVGNAPPEVRADLQLNSQGRVKTLHFSTASYGDGIAEGLRYFGFLE